MLAAATFAKASLARTPPADLSISVFISCATGGISLLRTLSPPMKIADGADRAHCPMHTHTRAQTVRGRGGGDTSPRWQWKLASQMQPSKTVFPERPTPSRSRKSRRARYAHRRRRTLLAPRSRRDQAITHEAASQAGRGGGENKTKKRKRGKKRNGSTHLTSDRNVCAAFWAPTCSKYS